MTYSPSIRAGGALLLARLLYFGLLAGAWLAAVPLWAAGAGERFFDISAGQASATLKQFTTQAGEQLLYSMDAVRGIASRAVKGRMNPRDALAHMFDGTALTVVQDRSNGALSLVRNAEASAPSIPSAAETLHPKRSSGAAGTAEEPVTLTPFTVVEDQDTGYIATNSLAGSRLNTALKDTAASLSVLTKEFMDDIGATNIADAIAWSTNSQQFVGDSLALASGNDDVNATFFNFDTFRVRGLPATQTKNYFEWSLPTDTYNSDRVEEARGPNSILFGIGSAGGVINSSSKRANLARSFRSATLGLSSHGGYRGTIDANERAGRRLAVRINGVYDRTKSFRNFNFGQKQLADIAATYRVDATTALRAEYETGRIRENVGTNQQATDQYTSWTNAGRELLAPWSAANDTPLPAGITRFAATPRVTYVGNTGTVMNLASQYATSGTDYALAPDVVPYRVSVGGPGELRRPHFDTVTVALEHRFGRNTFAELAYNHQQYHTFNQQVNSGVRLFIDPNTTLPTGQPNPHAGQYYIESESWAWNYGLRSDTSRVSLAHDLDLEDWGRYRFAALGEYQWRSYRNALMFEVWADHPFSPTPENSANVVVRRQYVTLGDWDHFYYPNPIEFGLIRGLTDPVTGQTLNSTWIPRNAQNMRDNPEHQKSLLLATQARYFKERLVLGLGFRADRLDSITRGTTRNAAGLIASDYANNTFARYDGRTKTLGAVYHVTPQVSVFYNRSDNFNLPPAIFLLPDGHRAGNPEGRGTDYGIAVTLFDGRLYARANYFQTDLINGTNSNYGGTVTAPSAVGNSILDALVAEGLISAADADARRVVNTGSSYAQQVKGYEFNLTANPTANWRLQANFSYTDGFTSEVAPEVQAWAATQLPFFRRFDPNLPAGGSTIGQVLAAWEDYNNSQLELMGLTLAGNRKYKVNLYTTYSFNDGVLRGLRIGGGYRHQSKIPIGQYADTTLQYGPSWWDSSAMIGYWFARTPLSWLKRFGLQLNVNNVFNEDDPFVLRRSQDTTPEAVRRLRVREPRTWRLTASFEF